MKLTPLDIHHKEFHRSIRGYNEEEVDVFLDEVADEFERLFKENISLQEQIEEAKQRMQQYQMIEQTLQNTLFTAQKTAEELLSNAKKEAELIGRDAELKAKDMIQQALAEKQRIQQMFLRLKQAEEEFRMQFKTLLDTYTSSIQEVPVPEDIMLLTTVAEGETAGVGTALVIEQPPELEAEAAPAELAAEVLPEPAAEPVAEAAPEPEAPMAEAEPPIAEPASEFVEAAAAQPAPVETAAPEPAQERLEEPLLSEVTTLSSADGSVKGLTLGEVDDEGPQLGDDIELPSFLRDPVDRTDEERERLRRHGSEANLLAERDEDTDIEEIS